jgi:hypothetical protein
MAQRSVQRRKQPRGKRNLANIRVHPNVHQRGSLTVALGRCQGDAQANRLHVARQLHIALQERHRCARG